MKSDSEIWDNIKASDQRALKMLFERYFTVLVRYASRITANTNVAEELVEDVFIYIWEKRNSIQIQSGIKPYLYTAARNASFNFLKSRLAKANKSLTFENNENDIINNESEQIQYNELKRAVTKAIERLPDACKTIFVLSRNIKLSNQEIANELNISIKTVEGQMTIALRKIRAYLQEHWYIFLILFSKIY